MTKKSIIALIVLITSAAIFAGLPYITGLKAEAYFRNTMMSYSENPSFNFKVTDYKRNWFNSYAKSEMEIAFMNEKVPIIFEHEIEHGPSFSNIELAKITTRVKFSEDTENELKYYFKDSSPIEIITHVKLLGNQEITFSVPSFNGHPKGKEDVNVNWQRLDGEIALSSDMSSYTGKMRAPLLAINGNGNDSARIDDVVMAMDMKKKVEGLWLGSAGLNIAGIQINSDKKSPGTENESVSIKDISLDQVSSDEDGLLVQTMIGRADSLDVMGRSFKEGVFESEFRNVSIDAFTNLQNKMKVIAEKDLPQEEASMQVVMAMTEILPDFLSKSPEYIIKRIAVSSDKGDISGNASVKYVGNGDYTVFNPFRDITCDAMLSMPKEFVREIAMTITRKQISTHLNASGTEMAEEDLELLCQQAVDKNLEGLQQNKIIVNDGDNFTTRFALRDTGMTVNDQPLNIPGL